MYWASKFFQSFAQFLKSPVKVVVMSSLTLVSVILWVTPEQPHFSERLFTLILLTLNLYLLMARRYGQLHTGHESDSKLFAEALSGLLQDSLDDTLAPSESWTNLLLKIFTPVSMVTLEGESGANRVEESGSVLIVAANRFSRAQRLEFAEQGNRPFSDQDPVLLNEARKIFERLWDCSGAYKAGQCNERKRIRRDLHDHVGHKLLSMIHAAPDLTTRGLAEDALKELGNSISKIRLNPSSLEDLGNEIHGTVADICASASLKFFITNGLMGDERLVGGDTRRGLVSAVRESLSNVIRHSGASEVTVDIAITEDGNGICLVIKDNGLGFDSRTVIRGDGLTNIDERMSELGGMANWSFMDGTAVELNLNLGMEAFVADDKGILTDENVERR